MKYEVGDILKFKEFKITDIVGDTIQCEGASFWEPLVNKIVEEVVRPEKPLAVDDHVVIGHTGDSGVIKAIYRDRAWVLFPNESISTFPTYQLKRREDVRETP